MWEYTKKVMEHFKNPRNVGTIEDPDGVGMVGSLACGDALKLMFKLDKEKKRIAEVKFQTFGCASAIASSSALTELLIGKTLEEAEKVTNQDIATFLGGLPEQKMHCSVLGRDALLAAIEHYNSGGKITKKQDSKIVCTCFGVTQKEIERVVRENNLTTVEEVTNFTKAGGGCGGCVPEIEEILKSILATIDPEKLGTHNHDDHSHFDMNLKTKTTDDQPKQKKKLTAIQKIQLIQETIDREIRPELKKDGGDIELIDVDGPRVLVALRGVCSHCHHSELTIKNMVETKLREFVSNDLIVEQDETLQEH